MKRVITFILIAVSVILYAGCTDFSEDIKNLQAQIDALKSERINTIDEQVSSIKSSLSNLQGVDKDLQTYIDGLKSQLEALTQTEKDLSEKIEQLKKNSNDNKETLSQLEEYKSLVTEQISSLKSTIETLQAKDKDLQSQIEKLQDYIDSGIKDTKDWVSATFFTLDQYNATASIIASIQTQIETINSDISLLKNVTSNVSKTDLDKAIASSESAIKDWVNSLLEGYYTAEQTEAKLAALKEELSKTGSESTIKDYETKLANIKSEITDAYTAAITKAIKDYNGTITSRIASEISTVNGKISSLRSDLTALESRMDDFEERLSKLEELVNNLANSGSNRRITGKTTDIDWVTWMNYNVGADESDILGDTFTYEEAKTVCPDGYRLPTIAEACALSSDYHSSNITVYNMVRGAWLSGILHDYSATTPAVFIPGIPPESSEDYYYYWSSTDSVINEEQEQGNGPYIWYVHEQGTEDVFSYKWNDDRSRKCYVRCVKNDLESMKISGSTTDIDGVTWMNYNVGADESDIWGNTFTYEDAKEACPTGYRLPDSDEVGKLFQSGLWALTVYNGFSGYWILGGQTYSSSGPALFFPCSSLSHLDGRYYWKLSDDENNYMFSVTTGNIQEAYPGDSLYVRCVKDE